MKNKFSEAAAGYGFINFANDQMALTVMHKLNGKMMPNTNPPVRWKLNHSSNRLLPGEKNHSVWVGDLTPEVCVFFSFVMNKYNCKLSLLATLLSDVMLES